MGATPGRTDNRATAADAPAGSFPALKSYPLAEEEPASCNLRDNKDGDSKQTSRGIGR